jgi:hypothetical protein
MKKILLSTVAMATIITASSGSSELEELKNRISTLEKYSHIKSKVPTLKFSGKHYVGFVNSNKENGDSTNKFETRRNYFQVKAYMNKKDFFRTTFDTTQDDIGDWKVRLKYAYLYLDELLPNTGIEIGQAHRPWIDYEEHGAWNYRSIDKVFFEDGNGAHLNNSADIGFNLKTKTTNFSSEVGIFNGEGYHAEEDGKGLSAEYRFTYHALATGKKKRKNNLEYFDISAHGVNSSKDAKRKNKDWKVTAFHAVYNNPSFLIAAQHIDSTNEDKKYQGDGYSINSEIRPFETKKTFFIARYDNWDQDDATEELGFGKHEDVETLIYGVVHKYNKNVSFIVNIKDIDTKSENEDKRDLMLSAEVNW